MWKINEHHWFLVRKKNDLEIAGKTTSILVCRRVSIKHGSIPQICPGGSATMGILLLHGIWDFTRGL
jgi:hypothetical protein